MTILDPLAHTRSPVVKVFVLIALSSFGFFLTFPYLALYLVFKFDLPAAQTGAIVGSVTLVASGGAWLGGRLSDRLGARRMVLWASILYTFGFLLLFLANRLGVEILALLLVGVARMLMEPALKTLLVRLGGADGQLFRRRYLTLVVAASLAPLCMAFVPIENFSMIFLVTAGLHATGGLLALSLPDLRAAQDSAGDMPRGNRHWPQPAMITFILLAGLAFFTVFSQFETTLALNLTADAPDTGAQVYRFALLANALLALGLVLGFEVAGWDTTQPSWIILGTLSFGSAALCLFLGGEVWVVAVGVVLFTLGEVLLFPLPDIFAARIATPGNEGRLMGLVDLRYLGFFIGPTLGGFALDVGPAVLALGLASLALALLPVFLLIHRRMRQ
jgi:MFS family permease